MGGAYTQVDPAALAAFARASHRRADDFDTVRTKVSAGGVGRMAFGIMPASFTLYSRYEEFLNDCLQGLLEGADAMADIATAVNETQESYVWDDQQVAQAFRTGAN